jgi:hypothetical protein
MLYIVIASNDDSYDVGFYGGDSVEDATSIIEEPNRAIEVITYPDADAGEASDLFWALAGHCCHDDESISNEMERILTVVLNIGVKIGMSRAGNLILETLNK